MEKGREDQGKAKKPKIGWNGEELGTRGREKRKQALALA